MIVEKKNRLVCRSRRDFVKALALGTGYALGGLALPGCADRINTVAWEPVSFPKVAFYNFEMFDNNHRQLQRDLVVLVEGDKISAVENRRDLSGYKRYKLVDLGGRTLLPGLIDNHVHMTIPFMYKLNLNTALQNNDQIEMNFRNCVMSGVTTVRDMGGFPDKLLKFSERVDNEEIPGPRVISSMSMIAARNGDTFGAPEKAPYFSNPVLKWFTGGNLAERPANVEQIGEVCDRMVELGARWLKTMHQDRSYSQKRQLPNHTDEGYRTILAKAKKHGIKCALHQPFVSGFKKGVDLGFHTLEHMPLDEVIPDDYVEKFIRRKMAMLPTMLVFWDWLAEKELSRLMQRRGEELLMPEAMQQTMVRLTKMINFKKTQTSYIMDHLPNMKTNLEKMYRMGATIGIGTDIGGGFTALFGRYNDELRHFAAAGIPNFDILRQATSINAMILDMQDQIGTLEKGKLADMVAVRGNPLEDINCMDNVDMVIKGGRFIKTKGIRFT